MTARRIWPKVVAVICGILLIAGAVGYVYWQNYLRSPQYSIAMLAHEVLTHDWPGARKYVDVAAITGAALEEELARATGNARGQTARLLRVVAEAARPKLTQMAAEAIQEAVEQKRDWGAPAAGKLATILAVSAAVDVTADGDRARATVEAPGNIGTMRLAMARKGDHWQVVQVDDAIDLITRLTAETGVGNSGRPQPRFDLNALRAVQVIEALKAAGVPIAAVQYLTANDDPAGRLGRPGHYQEKAVWSERQAASPDPRRPDGIVEAYSSADAAHAAAGASRTESPGPSYAIGNAVVRIAGPMTARRAAAYRHILERLR